MQDKHIDEMKDTMKQTSKFAWARGEGRCPENLYYNEPIMETSEFLVVPSLGSIVPGWLLIVPKVDVARFSELPRQSLEKLETLLETLKAETENTFGRAYLFEHGGHVGSKLSCGVDQAHARTKTHDGASEHRQECWRARTHQNDWQAREMRDAGTAQVR